MDNKYLMISIAYLAVIVVCAAVGLYLGGAMGGLLGAAVGVMLDAMMVKHFDREKP